MTDETAKAILEYEAEDPILLRGLNDPSLIDVPLADLQRMAKLWLMRDEIVNALDDAEDCLTRQSADCDGTWELTTSEVIETLSKLKAIDADLH